MRTDRVGTITPANNYIVGRARRNLLTNSWIGAPGHPPRLVHLRGLQPRVWRGRPLPVLRRPAGVRWLPAPERHARKVGSEPGAPLSERVERRRADRIGGIQRRAAELQPRSRIRAPRRHVAVRRRALVGAADRAPADPEPELRHRRSTTTIARRSTSIETRVQEATAGIRFRNNGSANFTATRTFDRLFEPFEIRSNISIPPGDYEYTSYAANANIGNGRPDHRERQRRLGRVLGRAQQIGVRRHRLAAGLPLQLRRQLQPESRHAAERRVHHEPDRHEIALRVHAARILQRIPPVQRGHTSGELEHPLQHHLSAIERPLRGLQRHAGHAAAKRSSGVRS